MAVLLKPNVFQGCWLVNIYHLTWHTIPEDLNPCPISLPYFGKT